MPAVIQQSSAEMPERVEFKLSQFYWRERAPCIVHDESGEQLLVVPVAFLNTGLVNRVDFLLRQLAFSYEGVDGCKLVDAAGKVIPEGGHVEPGTYHIRRTVSSSILVPRRGPRFKLSNRPANPADDDASTMSNSKRSSAYQSAFRTALAVRDYTCLLSDTHYTRCTAAHILPVSRPEYYDEIFGFKIGYLYNASFGVLLRDDLHHAFDRGEIAFWPMDPQYPTSLIVHIFNDSENTSHLKQYHGKIIHCATRFRGTDEVFPDIAMLLFHYQQCAIKNFRGFSQF